MGKGERPEHTAPADIFYNQDEAAKYTTNTRMIAIQEALTKVSKQPQQQAVSPQQQGQQQQEQALAAASTACCSMPVMVRRCSLCGVLTWAAAAAAYGSCGRCSWCMVKKVDGGGAVLQSRAAVLTPAAHHCCSSSCTRASRPQRALELLALPQDGMPRLLLDIGCGSGLSGEALTDEGHSWVGVDISAAMLDVAREREVGCGAWRQTGRRARKLSGGTCVSSSGSSSPAAAVVQQQQQQTQQRHLRCQCVIVLVHLLPAALPAAVGLVEQHWCPQWVSPAAHLLAFNCTQLHTTPDMSRSDTPLLTTVAHTAHTHRLMATCCWVTWARACPCAHHTPLRALTSSQTIAAPNCSHTQVEGDLLLGDMGQGLPLRTSHTSACTHLLTNNCCTQLLTHTG
jgi:SAM-dependent methyltransferase